MSATRGHSFLYKDSPSSRIRSILRIDKRVLLTKIFFGIIEFWLLLMELRQFTTMFAAFINCRCKCKAGAVLYGRKNKQDGRTQLLGCSFSQKSFEELMSIVGRIKHEVDCDIDILKKLKGLLTSVSIGHDLGELLLLQLLHAALAWL